TPDYTAGDSVCRAAGKPPCAFLHGAGNSGTGIIGCGPSGLAGIDTLDTPDRPTMCASGVCPAVPLLTFSGSGPRGSAFVLDSTAVGTMLGSCASAPTFCTEADPQSARGSITTVPLTTGKSQCEIFNANGTPNNTICKCMTGEAACPETACTS